MLNQSIELLYHFIGYFKVTKLADRTIDEYEGFSGPRPLDDGAFGALPLIKTPASSVDFRTPPSTPLAQEDLLEDLHSNGGRTRSSSEVRNAGEEGDEDEDNTRDGFERATPAGEPALGTPPTAFPIELNYSFFQERYQIIEVEQFNRLSDDDRVLGDSDPALSIDLDIEAALEKLAAIAGELPEGEEITLGPDDPAVPPEGLERVVFANGEPVDEVPDLGLGDAEPDETADDPENGSGLDDEEAAAVSPMPGSQFIETGGNTQVNSFDFDSDNAHDFANVRVDSSQTNDEDDGDLIINPVVKNNGTLTQTLIGLEGEETTRTTDGSAPGGEQSVSLGENSATNDAIIFNAAASHGSMIVVGSVHEMNGIYQSLILIDDDYLVQQGLDGPISTTEQGDNTALNAAQFIDNNEAVFGNPSLGNLPVGLQWHVDYIQGDYIDTTKIVQTISISDNDISVQTGETHYSSIRLGGNTELNEAEETTAAHQYDLIIVGGNYYEYNIINQQAILLDNDLGFQSAADGSITQTIGGGDNLLLNEAAITHIGGGDRFLEINDSVEDLVNAIAKQDDSFDLNLELGQLFPGNGSNEINVLFVENDYHEHNEIEQSLLISDVDTAEQYFDALGQLLDDEIGVAGGNAANDVMQDMLLGGNVGQNVARIVDVDSTSNFQFVGEGYYESNFLVQSELVSNDIESILIGDDSPEAKLIAELQSASAAVKSSEDEYSPNGDIPAHLNAEDMISHIYT